MKKLISFLLMSSFIASQAMALEGKLTVWSWDVAADALKALAPQFEKMHPDLDVVVEDMGNQQVYDQVLAGCSAGGFNLPDVVTFENGNAEKYWQNFPDCFVSLNQFNVDSVKKDFPDFKWTELMKGETTYAMPWDSGPVVIFYRRDLYEKAGVDAQGIETWDDYIAAGKKVLASSNGKVKMAFSGHASNDNWFSMMANQNGCSYFKGSGSSVKVTVNQPGCVKALDKLKNLTDADLLGDGGWDGKLQALKANRSASAMYGAWYEGSVRDFMPEQHGKWGVHLMPAFEKGGVRASNNGGSALSIASSSKNQKAAYEFMLFALTNEENQQAMWKNQGLVPSYLPAAQTSFANEAQPYWGNQQIWKLIMGTMDQVQPIQGTPYRDDAKLVFVEVQNQYLNGKYPSAQAALDDAAKQISQATGLSIAL